MIAAIACVVWRSSQHGASDGGYSLLSVVDIFAHTSAVCLLTVWCLNPFSGHVSMLAFGMLAVMAAIAGGGVSQSLAAQTTVGMIMCIGFAAAAGRILTLQSEAKSIDSRTDRSGPDREFSWSASAISLLTISLLLLTTSVVARATQVALPTVTDLLREKLPEALEVAASSVKDGGQFVSGRVLGSVRRVMTTSPEHTALRVYCDTTPGYLRGSVFTEYSSSRWRKPGPRRLSPTVGDSVRTLISQGDVRYDRWHGNGSRNGVRHFDLVVPNRNTIPLEVHNVPGKGSMVFTPLSMAWAEASAQMIHVDDDGLVLSQGIGLMQPYVLGALDASPTESISESERTKYTKLPPEFRQFLTSYASEIAPPEGSTVQKALSISRHFQENFDYSLNPPRAPNRADAIAHFLMTKHAAHCEYFATATTLLLRALNVPTRYVTGYVVDEIDDDDDYWIAPQPRRTRLGGSL